VTKKTDTNTKDVVETPRPRKKPKKVEKQPEVEVVIEDTPEVYANKTEEYIAIYSDMAQDEDYLLRLIIILVLNVIVVGQVAKFIMMMIKVRNASESIKILNTRLEIILYS